MGYHIDSLDMCYGIQLADSHGDIRVIYAQRVDARFSPTENLGSLYNSLCGLSIMNMDLLWCYSSTNSRIDRTKKQLCVILV